jgi:hypothetical protein
MFVFFPSDSGGRQHANSFNQSISHALASSRPCLTNGPDRRIIQVTRPEQDTKSPLHASVRRAPSRHFETLPRSLDLLFFPFSPEKREQKGTKKSEQLRGLPSPCPFREARGALPCLSCLSILFFWLFFVLSVASRFPFGCAFLLSPCPRIPQKPKQWNKQNKQANKTKRTVDGCEW